MVQDIYIAVMQIHYHKALPVAGHELPESATTGKQKTCLGMKHIGLNTVIHITKNATFGFHTRR